MTDITPSDVTPFKMPSLPASEVASASAEERTALTRNAIVRAHAQALSDLLDRNRFTSQSAKNQLDAHTDAITKEALSNIGDFSDVDVIPHWRIREVAADKTTSTRISARTANTDTDTSPSLRGRLRLDCDFATRGTDGSSRPVATKVLRQDMLCKSTDVMPSTGSGNAKMISCFSNGQSPGDANMMLVAHALVPALSDVVASQVSKLRVESDSAHLNTLCDFIDDDDDDFALTVAEGSGALSTNRLAAHCAIQATGTILQTDNGTLRFTGHVSGTLHFNPHSSVPIQRLRRVDWDLETKCDSDGKVEVVDRRRGESFSPDGKHEGET